MTYFTDMSSMFMNLLSDRRMVRLELAIVVLILIEIVIFLWSLLR